jgi:hypothetical protein
MKFVIAALIGLTSAVPVTRILTDEGYVFMATEAVHKLNVKSKDYDKPSEYLCDGDKADDKEIQDAADAEDTIVEDFGFSGSRNARGQVRFVQLNDYPLNIDNMNLLVKNMKYSDELANGDRDDDKEVEVEHDPTDLIVDYNGHTNRGYAHTPYDHANEPLRFDIAHYADNNIKNLFPEHFGTVPRDGVSLTN